MARWIQEQKAAVPPGAEVKPIEVAPAVKAALEKCFKAHKALKAFSCQIKMSSKGVPRPTGTVLLKFERPGKLRMETRSTATLGALELMVCDGNYFFLTEPQRKTFTKERVPVGGDAIRAAFLTGNPLPLPVFHWLLNSANPLPELLTPNVIGLTQEADSVVNGVPVQNFLFKAKPGTGDSVLSFGKADGLLRRAKVTATRSNGEQIEITEDYLDLKPNPKLPEATWRFTPPTGFRDAAEPRPPLPAAPVLGPKAVKTASGLIYLDLKVGTGPEAKNGTQVTVHYKGTLTNGEMFDSSYSRNAAFAFALPGPVIRGWNEGVVGMKVGGKRKLVVPPDLGYGSEGNGPIPGGATLIFEIELLEVKGGGA